MENKEIIEHESRVERISYSKKGRFFKLRNFLNLMFILLCAGGMATFLWWNQGVGGLILITAVVFKLFECVLRIIG